MKEENLMMEQETLFEKVEVTKSSKFKYMTYRLSKRTFDVLISIFGILLLLPISIVIKIAYLLTGDFHSIFYKQERIGLFGNYFKLYKFRTMKPNADEILVKILENNEALRNEFEENKKMKQDPRVTKVGRIIRKLSLDEFPQFINIFKGDMSFVGNRPYLPREKEDMGNYYKYIVATKPGLTGYWQTSGRSNTNFLYRLQMEKIYCYILCFKIDFIIIVTTLLQLFKRDGAF